MGGGEVRFLVLSFKAINSMAMLRSNWGVFNSNRIAEAKMWIMTQ